MAGIFPPQLLNEFGLKFWFLRLIDKIISTPEWRNPLRTYISNNSFRMDSVIQCHLTNIIKMKRNETDSMELMDRFNLYAALKSMLRSRFQSKNFSNFIIRWFVPVNVWKNVCDCLWSRHCQCCQYGRFMEILTIDGCSKTKCRDKGSKRVTEWEREGPKMW